MTLKIVVKKAGISYLSFFVEKEENIIRYLGTNVV